MISIDSPIFISSSSLEERPDWDIIFNNNGKLALEIGCGTGDFVVEMARLYPDNNFIALDYYNKGCLKSCRRAERYDVANVRVIRDEARSFVSRCIHPASLSSLYINCPDPWPKRRHRKRRLVNEQFLRFMDSYLAPDADFYFATDFDDYGVDVARMMLQQPGFMNMLEPEGWQHELIGYPITKYMKKFMAEGKKIYFVHFRRSSGGQEGNEP